MSWVIDDTREFPYVPELQSLSTPTDIDIDNIYTYEIDDTHFTPVCIYRTSKEFSELTLDNEYLSFVIDNENNMAGLHYDMSNTIFTSLPNTYVLYCDDTNPVAHLVDSKTVKQGAFRGAKLQYISIPKSCVYIGPNAFRDTDIKKVTISRDCVYESNSFPPDCIISYYE